MKKCKWAGDVADEYCKSCDGIKMMVEGIEKSCSECNGYEEGDEEVTDAVVENEPIINEPEVETKPIEKPEKSTQKPVKNKKPINTTSDTENTEKQAKNDVKKVSEVKEEIETVEGIKVVSIRYTSGATVKRGDNYYKFIAEEEWNVENANVEDAREKLWAKLNAEVDNQIEELKNM